MKFIPVKEIPSQEKSAVVQMLEQFMESPDGSIVEVEFTKDNTHNEATKERMRLTNALRSRNNEGGLRFPQIEYRVRKDKVYLTKISAEQAYQQGKIPHPQVP